MNLQAQSSALREMHQLALSHFEKGEYGDAALLYEQLIELEPASKLAYWYLGLVRLLQSEDAEAQLIWMMAMAEGEPAQVEQWTLELLHTLQTEAQRQEKTAQLQAAWTIRQCIQGIDPSDAANLLQILHLALELETFTVEDLMDLGIIERLRQEPLPNLNPDLIWQILQILLERGLEYPVVLELVEASLPYANVPQTWIAGLLPRAVILSKLLRNNTLACRYGELCLQLDPQHSETLLRLASFYQDEGRYTEGIAVARRYFAGCQTTMQKVMGNALVLRGLMTAGAQWQEAETVLQQGMVLLRSLISEHRVDPQQLLDASILCTPVFFYPYFGDRPSETRPLQNQSSRLYQRAVHAYIEHNIPDYRPAPAAVKRPAPSVQSGDRQPLRVGYLSRCLWRHSVGWLCRWVFQHFDRDRFQVYAYFNHQTQINSFSQRWFASQATQSRCFKGDEVAIARAIQQDEIDILVDLDSITSDYTCSVMALKPAPIQVTWLGLDASGLPAIDYFIADPYVLPDNASDYYAERIWRLPHTYIAVDGFEVGVPTLRRDHLGIDESAVIYLSAQSAYKRHPDTMRLQMQILREVPNSYFLLKGSGDQRGLQAFLTQIAEEEGVEGDRLRFLKQDNDEETHRANLRIADVVLDTFPYNGATTTLETLWMGIPLVTRVGQQFAARNSYTMLVNAGISEGIAWTDDAYVEWGVRLGKDAALRQSISWRLWRSRQTAPLWNGRQFTRDLEQAYEQMWAIYQGT